MATFNKFQQFVEDVAHKVHNLGSDTITVALSDTQPVNTNTVIANITELSDSYANLSTRNLTLATSAQSSGTYTLDFNDLVLTSTGVTVQFQYVVIYNSTTGSGNLIGWYDYGAAVNLADGEKFTITFDALGMLTLV